MALEIRHVVSCSGFKTSLLAGLGVGALLAVLVSACGADGADNGSLDAGRVGVGCPDGGVASGIECKTSVDCFAGQSCVAGECSLFSSCASAVDCPKGKVCGARKACIDEGTCVADEDCSAVANSHCSQARKCVPNGGCATNEQCRPAEVCNVAKVCVPSNQCASQDFKADPITPNLLITLDRSCSMTERNGGITKWASAVGALKMVVAKHTGQVRWGLTLFPDTQGKQCTQDVFAIPVGDKKEGLITRLLTNALDESNAFFPDGPCVTNIDTAMQQASKESAFKDGRPAYVLLVTDGKQAGCSDAGGDMGTLKAIKDLRTKGIKTFVVGFGGAVDTKQLDEFAAAGGASRPMSPRYFQANNASELNAQLSEIAASVITCTYKLERAVADPSLIKVFFDQTKEVAPNATEGWKYDTASTSLVFSGAACNLLRARQATRVDVIVGCPSNVE